MKKKQHYIALDYKDQSIIDLGSSKELLEQTTNAETIERCSKMVAYEALIELTPVGKIEIVKFDGIWHTLEEAEEREHFQELVDTFRGATVNLDKWGEG